MNCHTDLFENKFIHEESIYSQWMLHHSHPATAKLNFILHANIPDAIALGLSLPLLSSPCRLLPHA